MTRHKSQPLKQLHGTVRRDRAPRLSRAAIAADGPLPPATLSAEARAEWQELAPAAIELGTLNSTSTRAFALLCEQLATAEMARAQIATEGTTLPTEGGGRKGNPLLRMMEAAENRAARLLASFGLTPRGLAALDLPPQGPTTPTPWEGTAASARLPEMSIDEYIRSAPGLPRVLRG